MSLAVRGKVWKFGGNIIGDGGVVPFSHIRDFSTLSLVKWGETERELGQVCMTVYDPDFPQKVAKGDIMVVGRDSFTTGVTHLQIAVALKVVGLSAVIADSSKEAVSGARLTLSGAVMGLPVFACDGISEKVSQGDELEVNVRTGGIKNLTTGATLQAATLPEFLVEMIEAGSFFEYLKKRIAEKKA